MDGNSRWATARGLPPFIGHERGVAALRRAVDDGVRWGLPALTVFAFSAENFARPPDEVEFLLRLFSSTLAQQLPALRDAGVRLSFLGDMSRLPPALAARATECQQATAGNKGLLLTVALGYGAQQDMVGAVRQLAARVARGELDADEVSWDALRLRRCVVVAATTDARLDAAQLAHHACDGLHLCMCAR
jgi:undecaprenyl diphosphate synthase